MRKKGNFYTKNQSNIFSELNLNVKSDQHFKRSITLLFNPRFLIYLLINFVIWPFVKLLLKVTKIFKFIFLVYPGTIREVIYYGPPWFRSYIPLLSIIGIFWSKNPMRRGLVLAIAFTPEEFSHSENEKIFLEKILENAKKFAQSLGIQVIGLAGVLPSLCLKHKLLLNPPFVKGDKGTVFTIINTLEAVVKKEKISISETTVGIIGVGFIGREVIFQLKKIGFRSIIGIDIDAQKIFNQTITGVQLSDNFELLSKCDLVLILTRRGRDIEKEVSYFKPKVIIIDDTYPPIPKSLRKLIIQRKHAKIYQVIAELPKSKFIPHLPGYFSNWLPGCAVECLVASNSSIFHFSSQEEFNKEAKKIGVKEVLISYGS